MDGEEREVCGLDLEGFWSFNLNFCMIFQNEPDLKRHRGLTQPWKKMLCKITTLLTPVREWEKMLSNTVDFHSK